jgi:hypothetical protein
MPEPDRPPESRAPIIDKQDPAGVALFGAILCGVFAVVQGAEVFRTGHISAEFILLVALTFVFLAAWQVGRRI